VASTSQKAFEDNNDHGLAANRHRKHIEYKASVGCSIAAETRNSDNIPVDGVSLHRCMSEQ